MSKPERLPSAFEGQSYFVSSTTHAREPLFRYPSFANLFIDTLYHYRREGNKLHDFALMPEHFHLLITPASGVTLERALQFIKGG